MKMLNVSGVYVFEEYPWNGSIDVRKTMGTVVFDRTRKSGSFN